MPPPGAAVGEATAGAGLWYDDGSLGPLPAATPAGVGTGEAAARRARSSATQPAGPVPRRQRSRRWPWSLPPGAVRPEGCPHPWCSPSVSCRCALPRNLPACRAARAWVWGIASTPRGCCCRRRSGHQAAEPRLEVRRAGRLCPELLLPADQAGFVAHEGQALRTSVTGGFRRSDRSRSSRLTKVTPRWWWTQNAPASRASLTQVGDDLGREDALGQDQVVRSGGQLGPADGPADRDVVHRCLDPPLRHQCRQCVQRCRSVPRVRGPSR